MCIGNIYVVDDSKGMKKVLALSIYIVRNIFTSILYTKKSI